ncbi:uncharacterized protein LOC119663273 [Teleopsis dalmanni]|uniref:uncharacterized protein LOC119663273 n=1 Tax=Teleopsis dalmanni TaxID=139649 RepID=UPI0018CD0A7C|nr:uncharacterized protein LOC119663273 [Teleopsis dalmanni]
MAQGHKLVTPSKKLQGKRKMQETEHAETPTEANKFRPMEAEASAVQAIGQMKLPNFLTKDPTLWFAQIEGLLHMSRVTADLSKFYTVITALDAETLQQVADIAKNPPETGKYDKLKKELISRFSESSEKQLIKLLTGMELSNKKPSQLVREMRTLAGANVSEEALTTLWLQRMPNSVRCILSACKTTSIDELAEIADRILDNSPVPSYVMTTNANKSNDKLEARVTTLESSVQQINQQLINIAATLDRLEKRDNSGRDNSRSRSSSCRREKVCYYHIKFGAAATKCSQPCEFGKRKSENRQGN